MIVHHVSRKILLKNENFENGQEIWKKAKRVLKNCFFYIFIFCKFVFCIFIFCKCILLHFIQNFYLTINIFATFENVTIT